MESWLGQYTIAHRITEANVDDKMAKPVQAKVERLCRKCGKTFIPIESTREVCPKCVEKLPKCFACGQVMATQYGYYEGLGGKVGGHELCASCWRKHKQGKVLNIGNKVLLPNGKVVYSNQG